MYLCVQGCCILVVNDNSIKARQADTAVLIHFHRAPVLPAQAKHPQEASTFLGYARARAVLEHYISITKVSYSCCARVGATL